jgi:hypothetical protein
VTKASQSAVRWIDPDASPASACSWCRHIEYVHANSGPCLFCGCTCPFFSPMDEPDVEASGEAQ